MARSRSEIDADLARLNAELSEIDEQVEENLEEQVEVIEEATEAHVGAVEEAAEEAVEEATEAIEEASHEADEASPLTETADEAERDVAAEVIARLEERYDLTLRAVEETHVDEEVHAETAPEPEHWSRRRMF